MGPQTVTRVDVGRPPACPIPISLLLFLVTAVQGLATFAVVALPTLATRAADTYGLGPQSAGYQITVIYIAAALVSSTAGLVVRRLGAGLTSLVALMLSAAGLLGIASGSLPVAIVASLLIGCCYGLTNPAASHLLLRFAPVHRQNLIFSLKQTGVPLGAILAASLLPLIAERSGWQRACVLGAGLTLLVAAPLALVRHRLDDDRAPGARAGTGLLQGVSVVTQSSVLRSLAVMGLAYASFQFCLFTFLVTMLVTDFGWSLVEAGGMASLVHVGGVAGRIVWSLLADRIGRGRVILAAIGGLSAVLAVVVAGAGVQWPVSLLAGLLFAFGFCLVGWNGLWMAEIARTSGQGEVGLATGGVLVFTYIGVMAGPALFAAVYGLLGSYALTFGAFAIVPLVGAAAILAALPHEAPANRRNVAGGAGQAAEEP